MCKNKDYCGPQVVNWYTWFLSLLVPDNLWGVYIGDICKEHDADYAIGGTEADRNQADEIFRDKIYNRIYDKLLVPGGGPKALAKVKRKAHLGSKLYYIGVHVGGKKQFNYKG